ncbi:MAG: rod shape-determining protein RodA [Acidimicrobiales bacterium]|jgi:rod shape determining protein RodA
MGMPVRKDLRSPMRFADFSMVFVAVAISILGVLMNYAATWRLLEFNGGDPASIAKRQAVFVVLGLIVMAGTATIDYRVYRDFASQGYLIVLVMLVGVLFFGRRINGARSWFEVPGVPIQLQPSEFAKVAVILALAAFVANHDGYLKLDALVNALLLGVVPMALIFRQPDIGTMLVFVAILMGMLLVAGAQMRHIVLTTAMGVLAILVVFNADKVGLEVVSANQESRLTAFMDPEANPDGAGYNLRQSQIAIGAGGLTGRGFLQGTQTNLNLVPEQETDFIFTAVGEEFGFVGGLALLLGYAYLLLRMWRAAQGARDLFGTFLAVGVMSMFLFQVFQNVGMTMGIMPITGIPLPFMSHGGSSTITAFAALGLAVNVSARRFVA